MTEVTASATLRPVVYDLWEQSGFFPYEWYGTNFTYTDTVTARRVVEFRSFRPYVKRKKPLIPKLSPTLQEIGKTSVWVGNLQMKTRAYPWSAANNYPRYFDYHSSYFVPAVGLAYSVSLGLPVVSQLGGVWVPTISLESEQLAVNAMLKKLKATSISPGVTAAEAVETSGWLAKRGSDLASIALAIKSGDYRKFKQSVRSAWEVPPPKFVNIRIPKNGTLLHNDIQRYKTSNVPDLPSKGWRKSGATSSNRWLEFRYAVLPLFHEATSYIEWIAKSFDEDDDVIEVEGENWRFYEDQLQMVPWHWPGSSGGSPGNKPIAYLHWKARIIDKNTAIYIVSDAEKRMRSVTGLTSTSAMEAIWEIIPYSFAADWFVSYGDYLALLQADLGLTFLAGWKNSNLKLKTEDFYVDKRDALALSYDSVDVRMRFNRRVPYYASARAGSVVRSRFGGKQMLDTIALLKIFRRF